MIAKVERPLPGLPLGRRARPRGPASLLSAIFLGAVLTVGCGERSADSKAPRLESGKAPAGADSAQPSATELDLTRMEPQVRERLLETRSAALASPLSAEAWGRYGMVAHAHELWEQAASAYRKAEELDPADVRWPYYLGDVISVQGTELEQAVKSFRRAIALRPAYAPAHMRLGKVLIELNQNEAAAPELALALDLAPELQPARVALAQVRLAEGDLEASERLLEEVLEVEPRHGQALSTLGRVYMRQNRRELAREIAERARDAASYNLFSDPLMAEVVGEGVSSAQIWDRAKSFLEKGDYEQAAIGLRRVLILQPENSEAHLQLAFAYTSLGDLARSRYHLERVVALDPAQVAPRLDLAQLLLAQNSPQQAVEQLRRAQEADPDEGEVSWLLGRALVESGNVEEALGTFESASRSEAPAPGWAQTAWGRALAQTGRPQEALDHLRAALSEAPENPEAHFYTGLVMEGLGRLDEAVASYCRSEAQRPESPASARLRALQGRCP